MLRTSINQQLFFNTEIKKASLPEQGDLIAYSFNIMALHILPELIPRRRAEKNSSLC